jgi:hypothetical protein
VAALPPIEIDYVRFLAQVSRHWQTMRCIALTSGCLSDRQRIPGGHLRTTALLSVAQAVGNDVIAGADAVDRHCP